MAFYNFNNIEKKWREVWKISNANKAILNENKKKCYVLDMFPYPSGAGLHVGHPLGYIASDIYARYKRLQGFNVLHPIGFDAFGLPAEQYAVEHGISPHVSTKENVANFRVQLTHLALSFDWEREVITCDPKYYRWTQWIFLKFFHSWFNRTSDKAETIETLIAFFEKHGNEKHPFPNEKMSINGKQTFSALEWKHFSQKEQQDILMEYRLAYLAFTNVNWCEALGTVLANDEVINGLSYRGGHPVIKKKMRQWHLRMSEYADRLLEGLEHIDFSHAMKEMQRNWIGKSLGAEVHFSVHNSDQKIPVFTTRPDTIFGVDFMVLAPEHDLVATLSTVEHQIAITHYLAYAQQRSEVDRMSDAKSITGCFTGSYAIHPFTKKLLPIWIGEYVLAHYGTGAIMAVPAGDSRDHKFAKHFNIPITNIFGQMYDEKNAVEHKNVILHNSQFLDGKTPAEAVPIIIEQIEQQQLGKAKVNYKMRDAGWSRQRYWGEPFPIYYNELDTVVGLEENELPLTLPSLDNFHPTGTGEGPLAHVHDWVHPAKNKRRDTNTMPTHAGAAWYFLRFMDPHNEQAFADEKALQYWNQVDVYVGGAEHAVAHLLYARLWTKVLYDLGYLSFDEPFKKLINQGKIMGDTRFVYRIRGTNQFVSHDLKEAYLTDALRVSIALVDDCVLNIDGFTKWRPDFKDATFILNENNQYLCGSAIEKMSKSYFNVVNPDDIIQQYGTDAFRMYEMFMGPLEENKPWDTKNIEGTFRFLKKLWSWLHTPDGFYIDETACTEEELQVLHKTIKKVQEDIERFSFNTVVSTFMSCFNEVYRLGCKKRGFFEPFLIMLSSFAPHITEEIWQKLGKRDSILVQHFPTYHEQYIKESTVTYVFCINGKKRADVTFALGVSQERIEQAAKEHPNIAKWITETPPKKVIFVKDKMVNFVV